MTAFHERLFHAVLDFFDLRLLLMFQQRLHALEDFLQLLCGDGHPVAVKGFLHGGGDFAGLVFLVFSVAFFDGGAHLVLGVVLFLRLALRRGGSKKPAPVKKHARPLCSLLHFRGGGAGCGWRPVRGWQPAPWFGRIMPARLCDFLHESCGAAP